MGKYISQLTAVESLSSTDKLEIETSAPYGQFVTVDQLTTYVNSLLTLHQVLTNGNQMSSSDIIKNDTNTGSIQLNNALATFVHSIAIIIQSFGPLNLYGTNITNTASLDLNNIATRDVISRSTRNTNINSSNNTSIATTLATSITTGSILSLSASETDITGDVKLVGQANKVLCTDSSGVISTAIPIGTHYASDAAAGAGGVPIGGIYFSSSTGQLHTRMS